MQYVSEIVCLSEWNAKVEPFYSFKGTNITLFPSEWASCQCNICCYTWDESHWVIQVLKWVSMSPWGDVWLHCSLAACFTCPVLLCSVCVPDLRVPLWPGRHWCDWPHLPPGPVLLQGPGVPACWQARVSHPLAGISAKEAGEKRLSLFLYSTYLRRASDSLVFLPGCWGLEMDWRWELTVNSCSASSNFEWQGGVNNVFLSSCNPER